MIASACEDDEVAVRRVALRLLAEGRKYDNTTWELITRHVHEDDDMSVRSLALELLAAHHELDEMARIILTTNLNGVNPYIDPCTPIRRDWVENCAVKLSEPTDKILKILRDLEDILPLKIKISS